MLAKERVASGLDPDSAAAALFGSAAAASERRRVAALWYGDHVVLGLPKLAAPFLSRTALFERGLRLARRMVELRVSLDLSDEAFEVLKVVANEQTPYTVHDTVFAPALEHLATPEQQAANDILLCTRAWAISGAYAQTELGHGSAVRGLETTATFLPEEDAFRLDSPGPTATKWWVGGLGVSATHAVVVAQLVMDDGSRRGVHMFLVRIREPDGAGGWRLVGGVSAGDIGPKMGFASVDNGWARFDGVRVPRTGLLAAAARVDRLPAPNGRWRGAYVPADGAAASRAAYRSLVAARVTVSRLAYVALSHGVTIAVRFAAGRAQFAPPGASAGAPETPLLDYPAHQRRLIPALATAYALSALAEATPALLAEAAAAAPTPAGAAKAVHVLSSALKVYVTEVVSAGLEECRRACGGQGYSLASGLPQVCTMFVHLVTAEGDNTVMCQQAARGLVAAAGHERATASEEDLPSLRRAFENATAVGGGAGCWTGALRLLQVGAAMFWALSSLT